jgi:hypothetical protein
VLVPAPLFLGRSHLADRVALLLKEVRMSRPRLALSFVAMAAVLVLTGRAIVLAVPLHDDTVALQSAPGPQAGAATPGQMPPRSAAAQTAATTISKLKDARPAFPPGSAEAPVIVNVAVDASGVVLKVTPVAGPADLADVAAAAAKQWKFSTGRPQAFLVGFNPASSMGSSRISRPFSSAATCARR